MSVYIALDIGGTKFLVASANSNGEILHRVQSFSPVNLEEGIALLHQMISEVCAGDCISGMGTAIGGPLDWQKGIVSPLHQLEWRNVPFKKIMVERWHCPFWVDVDTNIAALGEYYFGGEKAPHLLYLTLSTGMGGGYLIDGKIYRGKNGGHPEAGHISIPYRCSNPKAIQCECGVEDCLEAMISGNAIQRIYGKPAEQLSENEWEEVSYNLGQGLRNLTVLYHPDIIVLGGGVACGRGSKLIIPATKVMLEHLRLVDPPLVRLSNLGYDTALKGAIAAAIHGIS
jgi:glucokinase